MVVGVNPDHMFRATRMIIEAGGGLAAVGPAKAMLPLLIAGLISEEPAEKVAENIVELMKQQDI